MRWCRWPAAVVLAQPVRPPSRPVRTRSGFLSAIRKSSGDKSDPLARLGQRILQSRGDRRGWQVLAATTVHRTASMVNWQWHGACWVFRRRPTNEYWPPTPPFRPCDHLAFWGDLHKIYCATVFGDCQRRRHCRGWHGALRRWSGAHIRRRRIHGRGCAGAAVVRTGQGAGCVNAGHFSGNRYRAAATRSQFMTPVPPALVVTAGGGFTRHVGYFSTPPGIQPKPEKGPAFIEEMS